ncbi:MAG: hypothetical protein FJ138_07895 [Deltaproteobacteria bacterium]|nr:hypothetical protein [Deltaproteobacteria bacterium]
MSAPRLRWLRAPHPTARQTLDALYAGEVLHAPPTAASRALVDAARAALRAALGDEPRRAHARLSAAAFFEAIGRLRRELYLGEPFHALTRGCMEALGFSRERFAFDPARLRVISHDGHLTPAAAPVYYPHRDVWYGHPACLVTWWVPLDDLEERETFVFYPEELSRPVPNDSEVFDYDEWTRRGWDLKIGWQDVESGLRARYPQHLGPPPRVEEGVGFSCARADNLLFAGAHFHQTRPQSLGTTRFSLDFRVVEVGDHAAGRGAPRVDDRSVGDAVGDYVPAGAVTWER